MVKHNTLYSFCSDIRVQIYDYLDFISLLNIHIIDSKCFIKPILKDRIRTFIIDNNIINNSYIKDFFIQIYYIEYKKKWNYFNVCSNKNVYNFKRHNTFLYSIKDTENTQETIIIYNKFNYNNIIQNTYKFKGLTFLSG